MEIETKEELMERHRGAGDTGCAMSDSEFAVMIDIRDALLKISTALVLMNKTR